MGTRALAALAFVGVLVAGCTDDPEPKIADPTPSSSSSVATPSPTVSEAADPEQAYREFIDTYVAAISDSLSTGDPSAWLAMSDRECKNCRGVAKSLRQAFAGGGSIEGAAWTVSGATYETTTDLGAVWNVEIARAEEHWLDGSGAEVKVVPAGSLKFGFAIAGDKDLTVRELKPLDS